MAGRIPEDIIDKIRDEVAIEDVVGHFVPLKRKGGSFWGLCPFHGEKTPSFHVHPERQIFYCFGCGRGGNCFRFLMEREGMSFPEAVQWCASRIGLDLARFMTDDSEGASVRTQLFEMHDKISAWFEETLQSPAGSEAREYCRLRGLRPETIEAFRLGLAPRETRDLENWARAQGVDSELLLQAQLLRRKDGRAPFAYFRSRLIFPIAGVAQKIHGFGGRILGPGEPKYLNSPETAIFHKRSTLYALGTARKQIIRKRTAILVEGYLDALALHQAGWTEAVATCGTALTPSQVSLLSRYAERVILLFDGDRAGVKAAFKGAEMALAGGIDVRIARLPAGQDPADLLQAGEAETLQSIIEGSQGLVGTMLDEVEKRGGSREMKERALHHLREVIAKVPEDIRSELLRQEAADSFGVPVSLLRRDAAAPAPKPKESTSTVVELEQGPVAELERRLLLLAMSGRKARHALLDSTSADIFESPRHRAIYEGLSGLADDVDAVRDRDFEGLDSELHDLVARLLIEMPNLDLDAAAELVATLEQMNTMQERQQAGVDRNNLNDLYYGGGDWKQQLSERIAKSGHTPDPTKDS